MPVSQLPRRRLDPRALRRLVGEAAVFRGATPTQLTAIAKRCSVLEASRGELVALRNVRLPGIFAVASGKIKLALHHSDGKERVLALVQAGESFGEATALLDRPSGYEAWALAPTRLVVTPPASVYELIDSDPRAGRRVVRALASRNLELLAELEACAMRRGVERLATYLDSLAKRRDGGQTWTARLPATKTLIASLLDMKKETLSRLLRSLTDQKIIEVRPPHEIEILDRDRLARLREE